MLPFGAEIMMARRRIGQERLDLVKGAARGRASLDEMSALIDWIEIDRRLVEIYAAAKGEPAWPPLALFRALLLAIWHDLSDVKLAEALAQQSGDPLRRYRPRTGPASGAFAASPPPKPRPSAPPSYVFALSWSDATLIERCSRRSRDSWRPRASRCAPARWSTRR